MSKNKNRTPAAADVAAARPAFAPAKPPTSDADAPAFAPGLLDHPEAPPQSGPAFAPADPDDAYREAQALASGDELGAIEANPAGDVPGESAEALAALDRALANRDAPAEAIHRNGHAAELARLLALPHGHPDRDPHRVWELHYLAEGLPVPGRDEGNDAQ